MDGNYSPFSAASSASRMDGILQQAAGAFEETQSLPDRDRLTYENGFYAYCSAIFVDLRDSSKLTSQYDRPRLAKLYRVFISEMVAALNGDPRVREVNIVGDCVWAVYNTPTIADIDAVFAAAARANSLHSLLNRKLTQYGFTPVRFGIGVDYGRALMIKAGYFGSGINDVVYMGDIVNRAAHLADKANKVYVDPVLVGATFAGNLNESNKALLRSESDSELGIVYKTNAILLDIANYDG